MESYKLDHASDDGIDARFCVELWLLTERVSKLPFESEKDRNMVYRAVNLLNEKGFFAIPFGGVLHSARTETPPSGLNLFVVYWNDAKQPIKKDTAEAYYDQESGEWYYAHSDKVALKENSVIAWLHKA